MDRIRVIMMAVTAMFCMTVTAQNQNSLTESECWLDNDVSTKQSLTSTETSIDISNLLNGLHSLTVRVKDAKGLWSSPMTKYFILTPNGIKPTQIVAKEYWFDSNVGNRQSLTTSDISMEGLNQGLHSFTLRVQDDAGLWSSPLTKYFLVPSASEMNGNVITRCQYWFDDARDQDNFADLITTCTLESENNNMVMVDIGDLPVGTHTIWWRVGDSKGAWSDPLSETFIIELITTGVDSPYSTEEDSHAVWFTIDGKKGIGTMRKGVVIVNGKKLLLNK